ncbi:Aminotransferase-like [Macleaya cordata]|uniref:Aminotransferase-like n=1 Tax=Macleaya cordata TaxID=56857 RepID=A0A200PYX1_MACCD|nr:Aminotransferase-like [Macleaya cordata]
MAKENEDTEYTIVTERDDKMISPIGSKSTVKIGKFLNPCVISFAEAHEVPLLPLLAETISYELAKWPSKIYFKGFRIPREKWKKWVDQLTPSCRLKWNQIIIADGIVSSVYKIELDKALIIGLAELWCPETNTFVFPWGEATVTLEDMLILGGFSVLGEPVTSPLTGELVKISDELHKERRALHKEKARKASEGAWINRFMGSNSELEHVAFLSLWLSRYVFPDHPDGLIRKEVFSVAVHLAQGTTIALAPAVLASLYANLTSLKQQVLDSSKLDLSVSKFDVSFSIWGPFQLLQIWAWEHFPPLRPKSPNSLTLGEPRIARWNNLKSKSKLPIVRSTLKNLENFQWRPFVATLNNWPCPLFYKEREELFDVRPENDELQSFFRCLRACEIFALNGSVEQYLPHRVARQFGFDQEIPGKFIGANATWELAWKAYEKSTRNGKLYIRSRFLESSSVTTRYQEWWKQSMSIREVAIKAILEEQGRSKKSSSNCSDAASKYPSQSNKNKFQSSGDEDSTVYKHSSSKPYNKSQDSSEGEDNDLTLSAKFKMQQQATSNRYTTSALSEEISKKRKSSTMESVDQKIAEKQKMHGNSIDNPITIR